MEKIRKCIERIKSKIADISWQANVKTRLQDFTRKRKIGFIPLMYILLNLNKRSLQLELDDFIDENCPEIESYRKQSFSDARMKIKPTAFQELNQELVRELYSDYSSEEYLQLAIDGTKLQLPDSERTRKHFGSVSNNHGGFETAQGLASYLVDVENSVILSAVLSRCDDSERRLAMKNIEELTALDLPKTVKLLITADRGYPSFEFVRFIESKGMKYLMRVKSNFFKEVNDFDGLDGAVTIPITPTRKKHLKQQGYDAQIGDSISVRVIKFSLTTGEVETLITNMNPNEADYTACQKMYAKRWGIEVLYDDLKNKIELENFTGDSVTAIQQDFFTTALFANFAALFQSETAILISSDAENSEKNTVTNQTETSSSAK